MNWSPVMLCFGNVQYLNCRGVTKHSFVSPAQAEPVSFRGLVGREEPLPARPIPSEYARSLSPLLRQPVKGSVLFRTYLVARRGWGCCALATEPNASAVQEKEMLVLVSCSLSRGPVYTPSLTGAGCKF